MGYRGKVAEREEARRLRALGWTIPDIAGHLGVARNSVSLWTRHVPVELGSRRRLRPRDPNALERRKAGEIAALLEAGRVRVGTLSERNLLIAEIALYAGEGTKREGTVSFASVIQGWSLSFADGFVHSSTSTKAGCGSRSTCTKGSTSGPLKCLVGGYVYSVHSIPESVQSGCRRWHSEQQA